MKIHYSAEADALSVKLLPRARSARMEKLRPGINADFDADDRLISIEVLRASESYELAELEALGDVVTWLTIEEAAKEAGLAPTTLRNQLNAGKLAGDKRGNTWFIAQHELWNYLERRGPTGRPPASRKGRSVRKQTGDAGMIVFPKSTGASGKVVAVVATKVRKRSG